MYDLDISIWTEQQQTIDGDKKRYKYSRILKDLNRVSRSGCCKRTTDKKIKKSF